MSKNSLYQTPHFGVGVKGEEPKKEYPPTITAVNTKGSKLLQGDLLPASHSGYNFELFCGYGIGVSNTGEIRILPVWTTYGTGIDDRWDNNGMHLGTPSKKFIDFIISDVKSLILTYGGIVDRNLTGYDAVAIMNLVSDFYNNNGIDYPDLLTGVFDGRRYSYGTDPVGDQTYYPKHFISIDWLKSLPYGTYDFKVIRRIATNLPTINVSVRKTKRRGELYAYKL